MSIRTSRWPAGVPCWADLTVPDVDAATAFYGQVLQWSFDTTGDEFGGYVIATAKDAAAAGIGPLPQEGVPSAWTLYLASDDADATAAAVREKGGTVLLEPGDVGALGRMFVATDPTGAVFGVWEARSHIGAGIVNEPGGLTWDDLRSPDPDAARAFYAAVFGYRSDAVEGAPADYQTFTVADEAAPAGGIGGMMGPPGSPAHWAVYFGAADVDEAAAAAVRGGGRVVVPAFDTPYGRMAGVQDPFGAVFFVVATQAATQPDRSG